jgi:hypothetical protein
MNKINLNDREWKPFKIDEIFNVGKGVYLNKKNIKSGKIPFITAKSETNGVTGFIGNGCLFSKNSITIEKISLSAYYQPSDFYCSHDVTVLQNDVLNKEIALFINAMIKRQGIKYSYGRQAQMNVVKRETILLPVDRDKNPDWMFMENYIKQIHSEKHNKYIKYSNNVVNDLKYKKIPTLNEMNWDEFFITDIFETIQRGKRLIKSNQINGLIPYVSSTGMYNGVDNFISNSKNVRKFNDCITIANSGSVGSTFYHPYEFVASDHITHLKNTKMNKFIYLFISNMMNRLSNKYNFNREINDKRISREKILLPITDNGEPNYEYMEQYIKNLMIKKYNEYLA